MATSSCEFFANCGASTSVALVDSERRVYARSDERFFVCQLACIHTKMITDFASQRSSLRRDPGGLDLAELSFSLGDCQETLCYVSYLSLDLFLAVFLAPSQSCCLIVYSCDSNRTFYSTRLSSLYFCQRFFIVPVPLNALPL